MHIFNDIPNTQNCLLTLRQSGLSYAFVPTMGNLHKGHLDLVRLAKTVADQVVVSIYVNPLQFSPTEDLDSYPRTFEADIEKLHELGVYCVFSPSDHIMYPEGKEAHSKVIVPELGNDHCGKSRPQFFDGVTTVVTKLLNIIRPNFSVFGEKDFQQLAIIKKMVKDLQIPTTVVSLPTVRDKDGLALSSRNGYLSPEERQIAPRLQQTLKQMKEAVIKGHDMDDNKQSAIKDLNESGFIVDYLNISDAETLKPACKNSKVIVILVAAYLGDTRLIDNIVFSLNAAAN